MASIPEDMIETINKIVAASRQEMRERGREPTLEELAQKLAIPLEKLRRVMDAATIKVRLP
jgi:RNA polymerase primary sigma factor